MAFSFRHISLLIGIFTVILSFLWFGRDTDTYNIILLSGLIVAFISFSLIFFKDTFRSKLIWFTIVIFSVGLQWLSESFLIKLSYRYFIYKYEDGLNIVNDLTRKKEVNLFLMPGSDLWTRNGYSEEEVVLIREGLKGTGIRFIQKDSEKIFYRTWGMLDQSHGVYYFYSNQKPNKRYTHIFGNWYF